MINNIYKLTLFNIVAAVFLLIGLGSYWDNLLGDETFLTKLFTHISSFILTTSEPNLVGYHSGTGLYEERSIFIGLILAILLMLINLILLALHYIKSETKPIFSSLIAGSIGVICGVLLFIFKSGIYQDI